LTAVRYEPGTNEVVVSEVPGVLLVQMNFTAYWNDHASRGVTFLMPIVPAT
jgi:hypothetical protein